VVTRGLNHSLCRALAKAERRRREETKIETLGRAFLEPLRALSTPLLIGKKKKRRGGGKGRGPGYLTKTAPSASLCSAVITISSREYNLGLGRKGGGGKKKGENDDPEIGAGSQPSHYI